MNIFKVIPVFAISMILIFGAGQSAFAGAPPVPPGCENPIAPFGASQFGSSDTTQDVWYCSPEDLAVEQTWYIGTPNTPVVVSADPNAGPWIKMLQPPIPGGFVPFGNDDLFEQIEVGLGPAWTDFHEIIITPGFTLEDYGVNAFYPSGQPIPPQEIIITPSPTELWIDFDPPLQPGSRLEIGKLIVWDDQVNPDAPLEIIEYPTFDIPVGGSGLPVDSVSLLLASASSMSLWMIPVIAGIGIGVFVIRKRI